MSPDCLSLVIRIVLLFVLSLSSELALRTNLKATAFFLFTVWFTIFRLTFFRAVSAYMGLFAKEGQQTISDIENFLMSSSFTNISDTLLLLGVVLFFWEVRKRFFDRRV